MNTVSGKCSPKVNVFQKLVFFLGPSTTRCEYTRGVNKKAANVHGARLCVSRSQPKLHFDPSVHTKKCNFLAGPLGSTVSGKRSPKVNVFQKRSSWASFLENVHSARKPTPRETARLVQKSVGQPSRLIFSQLGRKSASSQLFVAR